jgi:hypothetical protein
MGDSLSPAARALLEAAKADAPGAAARAQIWGGVSSATGLAATAHGAAGAGMVATTVTSGKLLVVGALLGSAVTAGFGYALVRATAVDHHVGVVASQVALPPNAPHAKTAPPLTSRADGPGDRSEGAGAGEPNVPKGAGGALDELRGRPEANPVNSRSIEIDGAGALVGSGSDVAGAPQVAGGRGVWGASPQRDRGVSGASPQRDPGFQGAGREDALGREAALVAEASGAVRRGDPESALASLDAARRLGSHRMEPEELSIRVRALRNLGRESEATETEATLRTKYPDHFLAR